VSTTLADAIRATKRHLHGLYRPAYNKLADSITTTDTSLNLAYDETVAGRLFIGIGTELAYVWSASGSTLTLERGMEGTDAQAHAADTLIEMEPTYPDGLVLQALRDELRSYGPSSLYRLIEVGITPSTDRAVDLGPGYHVAQVRGLRDDIWHTLDFRLVSASRDNLQVLLPFDVSQWDDLVADVAIGFSLPDTWATTIDLVDDMGFEESMLDIPPLGAARRLLQEAPRVRTATAVEPRAAQEVEAMQRTQVRRDLELQRQMRIDEIRRDLLARIGGYSRP